MNTTLLDIPVDYSGCESEEAKAQARVDARHKARKQIATQPDLLEALEDAIEDLQIWLDGATPGEDFPEIQRIIGAAQTAIVEAKLD